MGALLMAYGSPRTREEILPYYTDIRRGRPPSDQELADLVARYDAIAAGSGEVSPLRERTDAQRRAVAAALDQIVPGRFRTAVGMKHSPPSIEDAVADLVASGVGSIVALVLAPHFSSASIGEYVRRAREAAPAGVTVEAIESWATEPAYVDFLATEVARGLDGMPAGTVVAFTAHSLPERVVASGDPYPREVESTALAVATRLGLDAWRVAWQSAGRTPEPWLGPDIRDVIDEAAASGVPGVLVCACGFVADHLEVLYDLDVEARRRADAAGIAFARTACVNDDPSVMSALAARIAELA